MLQRSSSMSSLDKKHKYEKRHKYERRITSTIIRPLWIRHQNPPSRRTAPPLLLHHSSSDNNNNNSNNNNSPELTFGVLADIQYAPVPDGHSYSGTPRYYRHALSVANLAAHHFQSQKVALLLNLGDTIDGKCQDLHRVNPSNQQQQQRQPGKVISGSDKEHPICLMDDDEDDEEEENDNPTQQSSSSSLRDRNPGIDAINDVLAALSPYQHGPIIHTYGNHELYNLSRKQIGFHLNIPFVQESSDYVGYRSYSTTTTTGTTTTTVRFIILDSYDISIVGRSTTSPKYIKAHHILSANNPDYPQNPNSPQNLHGLAKRFVAFGGAIDHPQLQWLQSTLHKSRCSNERVILCSHQPILPSSTNPTCLIWNYSQVLSILRSYSDIIMASFAGHAHKGGYSRDDISGIHFRVFEAVLETPPPISTYAMVDLYSDKLVVRGYGNCQSATYDLDHMTTTMTMKKGKKGDDDNRTMIMDYGKNEVMMRVRPRSESE